MGGGNRLVERLATAKGNNEVLVNNDGGTDHALWSQTLAKSSFNHYYLVTSGNIHEIRGYNRLAKLAQGEILVFLQDDDLPPVRYSLSVY
eukprot:gene10846-12831_t